MHHDYREPLSRARIEALLQSNVYDFPLRITREGMLIALALTLIVILRVYNLSYNTLFIDEAIYVNVGYEVRHGIYSGNALSWMFGSFLYPIFASAADQLGGEIGVRLSSVALNVAACVLVFLTTRRVFGFRAALWALLLFGLVGTNINLARQAVYDAMGMTLAALALYWMVAAAQSDGGRAVLFAFGAGLALALCFLAKYIGILMLPAVIMVGVAVYLLRAYSLWRLLRDPRLYAFVLAFGVVTVGYLLVSFDEVRQVFTGANSTEIVPRGRVLAAIVVEIGLIAAFAVVGLVIAVREAADHVGLASSTRRTVVLFWLVVLGLIITLPLMQFYHVLASNYRALWKHNLYTLVLIVPLAGCGVERVLNRVLSSGDGSIRREAALLGASLLFVGLMAFISSALDHAWGFEYSWPNVTEAVGYLRGQDEVDVDDDLLVLSSVSTVYEYYLGRDVTDPRWMSNWFFIYEGRTGMDGIRSAIDDCALDLVILDDYYTTDINAAVEPALVDAGYIQLYSSLQRLHSNDLIGTRMYIPAIHNNCSWRAAAE